MLGNWWWRGAVEVEMEKIQIHVRIFSKNGTAAFMMLAPHKDDIYFIFTLGTEGEQAIPRRSDISLLVML